MGVFVAPLADSAASEAHSLFDGPFGLLILLIQFSVAAAIIRLQKYIPPCAGRYSGKAYCTPLSAGVVE